MEERDQAVVSEIEGMEAKSEQTLPFDRIGLEESRRDLPRIDARFEEFGCCAECGGAGFLVAKATRIGE